MVHRITQRQMGRRSDSYRRTPLDSEYSPSELLNGRKIIALIDVLVPSCAQDLQERQNRQVNKPKRVASARPKYSVETPWCALYCGPRRDKNPCWVPAVIVKGLGTRTVKVLFFPKGPTWKRHTEQLRPRFTSVKDEEISEPPIECSAEIEDVL